MVNLVVSALAMLVGIVLGFGFFVALVGVAYARKWEKLITAVEAMSDEDQFEITVTRKESK